MFDLLLPGNLCWVLLVGLIVVIVAIYLTLCGLGLRICLRCTSDSVVMFLDFVDVSYDWRLFIVVVYMIVELDGCFFCWYCNCVCFGCLCFSLFIYCFVFCGCVVCV